MRCEPPHRHRRKGYVYENYNALMGNTRDPAEGKLMGDNYNNWGALLGFIGLMETNMIRYHLSGWYKNPENKN